MSAHSRSDGARTAARLSRRAVQLVIALLVLVSFASARESEHERALREYQAGRYDAAAELWRTALRADGPDAPDRAEILHNLGNAAFRAKKPLEAAGWYSAALRLAPRAADTWHNLEFVRREAGLDPADRGDLTATVHRLVTVLTLAEAERLLLALAAALAGALTWEALRGGTAAKATSWACAALVALAAIPWAWQTLHANEERVFVTQPEGAPLTSEPRADAALTGRVAPGAQLERIDVLPGWVRVARDDGSSGWIPTGACVPLFAPYELPR